MEKEMTFIDLCVAIGRSFGRGCKALGCLLAHMTRLTFRYWWVVITLLVLAVAAALYYSRSENQIYRLNAVALLNGPSIQQFEQAYAPLRTGRLLPADAAINPFLADKVAKRFTTYRVVDGLGDGVADYIDFRHKSRPTDTINVQMQDRLCLQFRLKARDFHQVPQIEQDHIHVQNPQMVYLYLRGENQPRVMMGPIRDYERKLHKLRIFLENGKDALKDKHYTELDIRFRGQVVGR